MRIPSRVYHQAVKHTPSPDAQSSQGEGFERPARPDDVKLAVSQTAKQLAHDGALDASKVARLRAAIDQGFYRIDAGQLADTITETGG